MLKSIDESCNDILYTNNWDNALIRNAVRKELLCNEPNERRLFEYLKNSSVSNLTELRKRTFSLACDQYMESFLASLYKPVLRKITNPSKNLLNSVNTLEAARIHMPRCTIFEILWKLLTFFFLKEILNMVYQL
jgi:hypothetical protein